MSRLSQKSLLFAILTSLILVLLAFAAPSRFFRAGILPCTAPWAEHLVLALFLALLLQLLLARKILPKYYVSFLAGHVVLILLTLWLGLYRISPLGYSTGQISNLRGFLLIRQNRTATIQNDEIVSLKAGSAIGINSLLVDEASQCMWISSAGAVMDGASSCDLVYIPPNTDFDVLRLRIRSSCGLPDSAGRIRVSILP